MKYYIKYDTVLGIASLTSLSLETAKNNTTRLETGDLAHSLIRRSPASNSSTHNLKPSEQKTKTNKQVMGTQIYGYQIRLSEQRSPLRRAAALPDKAASAEPTEKVTGFGGREQRGRGERKEFKVSCSGRPLCQARLPCPQAARACSSSQSYWSVTWHHLARVTAHVTMPSSRVPGAAPPPQAGWPRPDPGRARSSWKRLPVAHHEALAAAS